MVLAALLVYVFLNTNGRKTKRLEEQARRKDEIMDAIKVVKTELRADAKADRFQFSPARQLMRWRTPTPSLPR